MRNFATIAALILLAATPALAQSNSGAGGSMSSGAMTSDHKASGAMSGSMSHGSMSGSMSAGSDHDKMAKPAKKKGAMTSGSMSGSMSNGSMTGSTNH